LGHKVHPTGFRIGVIRDWQAKWYAGEQYSEFVLEDIKLREAIKSKYSEAAISLAEIDRQAKDVTVTIHTARPGIVIGRGGQRVDEMRLYLENLIGKRVRLNIREIRQPELDAYLVARSVAEQIERRVAYRRAMKQAMFRTIQAGAKGIRVSCAGRLGEAEIARRQTMHEGQVPLHTLRADIDYGFAEAHTTFGRIGVKVWIFKGEILPEPRVLEPEEAPAESETAEGAVAEALGVAEAAAEESAAVEPASETKEEPEAAAVKESKAVEPAAEQITEEKPEKPATKPRARKTKKTEATAEQAEQEEKPAETEPKRRRRKTTAAKSEKDTAGLADIAAEAEASETKESKAKEEEEQDGTAT
jgi:small subunit ribosomal protein S3